MVLPAARTLPKYILCNKVYKEKADNRCGGAGQETMIIAPEVYEKNAPEKFIPIIMERNLLGKEYIPQYLKSLIYIDYTDKPFFFAPFRSIFGIGW